MRFFAVIAGLAAAILTGCPATPSPRPDDQNSPAALSAEKPPVSADRQDRPGDPLPETRAPSEPAEPSSPQPRESAAPSPKAKAPPAKKIFAVVMPGEAGSTRAARGHMDRLAKYIAGHTGWAEVSGAYFNTTGDADVFFAKNRVSFAIVSPAFSFHLRERRESEKDADIPHALLAVRQAGETTRGMAVLVPDKSPARALKQLRGKGVTGTPLFEPRFLRAVFAEFPAPGQFTALPKRSYLQATRRLRQGAPGYDALVINARQERRLRSKGELAGLRLLARAPTEKTDALPPVLVIGMGLDREEADALAGAFKQMRSRDTSRQLAADLRMEGFQAVDRPALARWYQRFLRASGKRAGAMGEGAAPGAKNAERTEAR